MTGKDALAGVGIFALAGAGLLLTSKIRLSFPKLDSFGVGDVVLSPRGELIAWLTGRRQAGPWSWVGEWYTVSFEPLGDL